MALLDYFRPRPAPLTPPLRRGSLTASARVVTPDQGKALAKRVRAENTQERKSRESQLSTAQQRLQQAMRIVQDAHPSPDNLARSGIGRKRGPIRQRRGSPVARFRVARRR